MNIVTSDKSVEHDKVSSDDINISDVSRSTYFVTTNK